MLAAVHKPGLFVTGTDTGVGKTVVAAAIARRLAAGGRRVGVCKVAATGCERRREGLVSPDAEYLAHWADAREPLDVVCPQRWAEPLAPAVAAAREGRPIDWQAVRAALVEVAGRNDVVVVEGVGGVMVPMDQQHTVLDVARWLALPTVVVARPGLGTINHTVLTVNALRGAGVPVAGVVVNRYPPPDEADAAAETNPAAIAWWGRVPVLCLCPDEPFAEPDLPDGVYEAVSTVPWDALAGRR